jgi:hypothetical protein
VQVIFEERVSVQNQALYLLEMLRRAQHKLSEIGVAEKRGARSGDCTCRKIRLYLLHSLVSTATQKALQLRRHCEAEPHHYAFPG